MGYTPTTDVIHAAYLACTDWESWAAYEGKNISELSKERDAEFDRWLAEVKAQAIVEDRAQLLDIAKGNLKGCSGYGCDECESVMFIDDIVVQRQIMSGEEHTHTKRSSFGDPYCKTCGIDLEEETE